MINITTFEERLRELMNLKQMTIDDLVDRCGASRTSICNWLSGKTVPDGANIVNLANSMGCSVESLFGIDSFQRGYIQASEDAIDMTIRKIKRELLTMLDEIGESIKREYILGYNPYQE